MDFDFFKDHLLKQYGGQLVLYVDDIARLLGKSHKATSDLIARGELPFKVKFVGRFRCVDIFQVAQWLTTDDEMAQECITAPTTPVPRPVKTRSPKVTSAAASQAPASEQAPALTGKVAAQLLKMRRAQAQAMGRFVHGLSNIDEVAFMSEVVDKLFYTADQLSSSHVVILRKYAPRGYKVLAEESRRYFDNEDQASFYLLGKLARMRNTRSRYSIHLLLEKSSTTLFHAIASRNQLSVLLDSVGFELPGL